MPSQVRATTKDRVWVAWTSELSPFGLKLLLLCQHAGLPVRTRPAPDALVDSWRHALRRERLLRGRLPLTWPALGPDDELPAVPFLFGPSGENLYDSSAIAAWLDERLAPADRAVPTEPSARFVAHLIDDYADEFGLYLVHHNRWKVAATDNVAGVRVAREFQFLCGPFTPVFARWFAARQVRRLPYLFSVAPEGFRIPGLPDRLQPPAPTGFPPTHALLEDACARLLDALESLLSTRPFVLGDRFTIADAALYGQLAMNLSDPSADRMIRERAPTTHAWVTRLHGAHAHLLAGGGDLAVDAALTPLLARSRAFTSRSCDRTRPRTFATNAPASAASTKRRSTPAAPSTTARSTAIRFARWRRASRPRGGASGAPNGTRSRPPIGRASPPWRQHWPKVSPRSTSWRRAIPGLLLPTTASIGKRARRRGRPRVLRSRSAAIGAARTTGAHGSIGASQQRMALTGRPARHGRTSRERS